MYPIPMVKTKNDLAKLIHGSKSSYAKALKATWDSWICKVVQEKEIKTIFEYHSFEMVHG